MKASKRLKRSREDPTVRLALTITTPQQARRGDLRIIDVANRTDADQKDATSLQRFKTVRRQTLAERLKMRLGLEDQEASACQWYADAHEEDYAACLRISDWESGAKSTDEAYGHWPTGKPLEPGASMFEFAREAISPNLRPMFERVVLHGWEMMPGSAMLFRLAARQLMHRIETVVAL